MERRTTARGELFTDRLGPLLVSYLTGKDAGPADPVFDMSLGEITLENEGPRSVSLKYSATQTFFTGHTITFGETGQPAAPEPESPTTGGAYFIDYDLPPGKKIPISRQDLMDYVLRGGPSALRDGTITTRFSAALQIDGRTEALDFGPHRFHVAVDRDWAAEESRYLAYFAARDAGG